MTLTRKDETRILVALARGYSVTYSCSAGDKMSRIDYATVEHGDRWRNLSKSSLIRLSRSGLVSSQGFSRLLCGEWSEPCTLTAAGRRVAADLVMDDDEIFKTPKVSSEEQRQAAKAKRIARQVAKVLTFNAARIRGSQVMFVTHGALVEGFASAYRYPLAADVMDLIRPHCEKFTDVDGQESLRITEAGIAATARPKRTR